MQTWQTHIEITSIPELTGGGTTRNILHHLGAQGWELVAVIDRANSQRELYFKRPTPSADIVAFEAATRVKKLALDRWCQWCGRQPSAEEIACCSSRSCPLRSVGYEG